MNILELKEFYVLDTETTGFKPTDADAIEVSALKVTLGDDGKFKVIDTFDTYINPEYPLPPAIVAFNNKNNTGVNDKFLSDKPKAKEAGEAVRAFLGDNPVLVGHNIDFDIGFVNKLYQKVFNIPFAPTNKVDTLTICREKIHSKSHKLEAMFKLSDGRNSADNPMFHNSLADCLATLDVLEYLKNTYYFDKGTKDISFENIKEIETSIPKSEPIQSEQIIPKNSKQDETIINNNSESLIKKEIEKKINASWTNSIKDIPLHMLDTRIAGIAMALDKQGHAIRGTIKINLVDDTKNDDLAEYIYRTMKETPNASQKILYFVLAERNPSAENNIYMTGYTLNKKQPQISQQIELNLNKEFYLGQDGFIECMNKAENLFKDMCKSNRDIQKS